MLLEWLVCVNRGWLVLKIRCDCELEIAKWVGQPVFSRGFHDPKRSFLLIVVVVVACCCYPNDKLCGVHGSVVSFNKKNMLSLCM